MKELFFKLCKGHSAEDILAFGELLRQRDVRAIFLAPTENTFTQLVRYGITGGTSFGVDYLLLYCLERTGAYYLVAAALAFIMGSVCNFMLTKYFAFRAVDAAVRPGAELMVFTAITAGGLGLTVLFIFLFTTQLHLHLMTAKFISSLLVFTWNFVGRKFLLYPGEPHEEIRSI